MGTLRLVVEYDGTAYHGFQWQPNVPTVQGVLEDALARVTGQRVRVVGAGRTDAGVHALGQVVSCNLARSYDPGALQRALNGVLPPDVAVVEAAWVAPGFHARFSARSRVYRYLIVNRDAPSPLRRGYTWHVREPLAVERMDAAVRRLVGRRDLAVFTGPGARSTVRDVLRAGCWRDDDTVVVEVEANAFLPHMMRHLVGALVQVGRGRLTLDELEHKVATGDRRGLGPAAPPSGLYLVHVTYNGGNET